MAESPVKANSGLWNVAGGLLAILVILLLVIAIAFVMRLAWDAAGRSRYPGWQGSYPATQTIVAPKRTVGGWCAPGRHLEFDQRVQQGNTIRDYKKCVDD